MSTMIAEDHARRESLIMGDLARLATSGQGYAEVVQAALDLIESLVSSPLLCLSIQEFGEIRHYARARDGAESPGNPGWAEEAGRSIARAQEALVRQGAHRSDLTLSSPWFISFPVTTKSGRAGALALGAADALTLSREEQELMGRLAQQVMLVLDHALLLEEIERLQSVDQLTGIANHRRLLELLDYEMSRHRVTGGTLALLILDIEGLRDINRSYGRQYGNHILRKLAILIRESFRPIDVVARSGVDEFAVMLPETNREQAQALLERLQERLLTVEFAGGEVALAAAVTQCSPTETITPESLLHRGEQALQESKRLQRGWTTLLAPHA